MDFSVCKFITAATTNLVVSHVAMLPVQTDDTTVMPTRISLQKPLAITPVRKAVQSRSRSDLSPEREYPASEIY